MIYFLFIAVALISLFSELKIIKQQKKEREWIYESLAYFFGLKRDYKIYVSCKGFSNWQKVQSLAEIKKSRIKNFCVCYPSGESVSDPNNYGSGSGYWIYIFKTESGEIKTVGCFLEDLAVENMKNQYFTKQN